jgi:hypothetical protein
VDSQSRTSEVVPSTSNVVLPISEGLAGGTIACTVMRCVVVVVVICLIKKRNYHEKISKSVEPDDKLCVSSQNSWSKNKLLPLAKWI